MESEVIGLKLRERNIVKRGKGRINGKGEGLGKRGLGLKRQRGGF